MRVLVVDDETDIATWAAHVLGAAGHDVTVVHAGAQVLADPDLGRFDVALVDLRMPHVGGAQVLAHLADVAPDVSRCAFTASAIGDLSDLTVDVDGLIEKPIEGKRLVAAVEELGRARD